jgi:hypothetical protein
MLGNVSLVQAPPEFSLFSMQRGCTVSLPVNQQAAAFQHQNQSAMTVRA